MSALINYAYLLLTDKINRAGINDYIHKKYLSKPHNTQVDIYFIFAM